MKSIIKSLGLMMVSVSPIVSIVSCGENTTDENEIIDHSQIKESLSKIDLTSYYSNSLSWGDKKSVNNVEDSKKTFGISDFEINKVLYILGDDWNFNGFNYSVENVTTTSFNFSVKFSLRSDPNNKIEIQEINKLSFDDSLSKNLIVNGEEFTVEEDNFFMIQDYYFNGKLWTGDNKTGSFNNEGFSKLKSGVTFGADQAVAEIENGDSIILIYDNDDTDGIHPGNFDDSVAFVDTSIAISDVIMQINSKLGNGIYRGSTISKFENGKLLPYFGGQSNHHASSLDFQSSLKIIQSQYDDERFEAVLAYYGYKNERDDKGDFKIDTSISDGASTLFLPFIAEQGLLSYEIIAKNAIKITYNNIDDEFGLPAAQLAFIQKNTNTENEYEISEIGKFSFGKNSWDVYEGGSNGFVDYTFSARKNIYTNN